MRRPEEPQAKPLDYGASALGLSTTPEKFGARMGREQNSVALRMFGKEFADLDFSQRSEVEEDVKKVMKNVPKGMTGERSRELAMRNQDEVVKGLKEGLSEENRQWLEKNHLTIGGFQNTLEIKGRVIRLTKEERETMKKFMAEGYEKALTELRARTEGKSEEEMQRYVSVYLEKVRKEAWGRMNSETGKGKQK